MRILDRHPFERDGTFSIVVISLASILQAILLIIRPVSGHATAVFSLIISLSVAVGNHPNAVAWTMIGAAGLALAGVLGHVGKVRLSMFAPQQLLLFLMAAGGMEAVRRGAYLDGTVIDWSHILSDQIVTAVVFVIHWNQTVRRARAPHV